MPNKNEEDTEEDREQDKEELLESRQPNVTFCLLTDIQYANVDDGTSYDKLRARYYRNSLNLVKEAVKNWKQIPNIKFLIQLGDLIDGKSKPINDSTPAMHKVLAELNKLFENDNTTNNNENIPKLLHIWGNHEFYNFKRDELVLTELNTAKYLNPSIQSKGNYYTFNVNEKLKLICLDFYDFSCLGYDESSEDYKKAFDFLTTHNKNSDLNSVEGMRGHALRFSKFNGSISNDQIDWLKKELIDCKKSNLKVIICGHLPIHPKSSDPRCLAWNNKEILEIIWSFDKTVIAYFCGYNIYTKFYIRRKFKAAKTFFTIKKARSSRDKNNIHHITFAAILETPSNSNAYATIKVFDDKVSVEGVGVIGYYEIYY